MKVTLDVCDAYGNPICSLYDSSSSVSGHACNIIPTTQRNGWKELNFTIPGKMEVGYGEQQPNFRLEYLKPEYRLRLYAVDDNNKGLLDPHYDPSTETFIRDDTDWYVISQPKMSHENFTVNMTIKANHISQILKTKNLGLTFSDKEGNNVGTAEELLETVLEGSGWSVGYVDEFLEKDGVSIKHRTLTASERTGAYALIGKIADLFEAKPIYHGGNQTVDLVPMNPFSEPKDGDLPDVDKNADGVFELHYGKNIKSVAKTLDTDNMVTRLYAYGSYGDTTTGYCGIDELTHSEWIYNCSVNAGQECKFTFQDAAGTNVVRYFTAATDINSTVVYSNFDMASMMYVWDGNRAHKVYAEPKQASQEELALSERKEEKNLFSSLMDFTYYDEVGLLTDEAFQAIARYQRSAPDLLDTVSVASTQMSEDLNTLSQIIGSVDFVKLSGATFLESEGSTKITFNGHVYTSEYTKKPKDWFAWRAATSIKKDGTAMNSGASIVYIVRNATPLTFEKYYIKSGSREDGNIVLWDTYQNGYFDGARVYIMKSNSARGYLSSAEDAVTSIEESLDESTKDVSLMHPTYFSIETPPLDQIGSTSEINAYSETPAYGWWWQYAYYDANGVYTPCRNLFFYLNGTNNGWTIVNYSDTTPVNVIPGTYHYNWRDKILRYCPSNAMAWHEFKEGRELAISQKFDQVLSAALRRQSYYDGLYQTYTYNVTSELPVGNYAMDSGYGIFWLFSTDCVMPVGSQLIYDTTHKQVTEHTADESDSTVEVKHFQFDSLFYHPVNAAENVAISHNVSIDPANGNEYEQVGMHATKNIRIYPKLTYNTALASGTAFFYNEKGHFISSANIENGSFATPDNARFLRIVSSIDIESPTSNFFVQANDYTNLVSAENETYHIIHTRDLNGTGVLKGLITQLLAFADTADRAYVDDYRTLKEAQDSAASAQTTMTNTLGSMYREGWWQKESYVDGDEQKLYDDALDTLRHISRPEETYNVSFVDYRDAEIESSNGMLPEYQHISIRSAAHLIDDDTGISKWAFIDTYKPCLDQAWKTQIQINTNLTTMGQHTFADVMAHIAEVANNISGNETMYARASVIGRYNRILAENIEGQFDLDRIKLTNATSNVYQDDRGNWIFETADGQSAMKLTGAGFCLASSKNEDGDWNWRTFGTGEGFSADLITSGHIKANLIEAGTITTEMIAAPVGSELNLVGNQSIKIVADTAIYDTDYSNGENLLKGATSEPMTATTTVLLNNIDLSGTEIASDMVSYRVFLQPTAAARAMLRVYSGDDSNDYYGNEITGGAEGWSTITTVLPPNAVKLGVYISGTPATVVYHSPKVEFGEIPTEFSKCPADIADNVRNLERAVLDVNPRYISQSVTRTENYREGNLYAESYDNATASEASVVCVKNVYHGLTIENIPASSNGVTITLPLALVTLTSDYTVSFMATASNNVNMNVSMSDASQFTAVSIPANTDTRIVAPFSSVIGPLTIKITTSTANTSVVIRSLMIQSGLVASEWVASKLPDPMIGANIMSNGGFSLYSSVGAVGADEKWEPINATAFVSNSSMNPGRFTDVTEGSEQAYVRTDPSCNTLGVIVTDVASTYGIKHTGVGVIPNEYYTFSCYAATLRNTQCSVTINGAEAYNTTMPVAITLEPLERIESYQYIEIPFKATSDDIEVQFTATAQNDKARIFVYHCKLEKGISATMYSDPILNTIYESYVNDKSEINNNLSDLQSRMHNAELAITPDTITGTIISNSHFTDAMDELRTSTIQQTLNSTDIQFALSTSNALAPARAWFKFTQRDDGTPVFQIARTEEGQTVPPFATEISNTELSFLQNNERIAYISNQKLYIREGEFKNGFKLGALNAIVDSTDDSINWVWDS